MNSTAMRTATPFATCSVMTAFGRSATSPAISTPRFIGPGCMISAPGRHPVGPLRRSGRTGPSTHAGVGTSASVIRSLLHAQQVADVERRQHLVEVVATP